MGGLVIILASGAAAGTLDILATSTIVRRQGLSLQRLLQFIASGALGQASFEGQGRTAALGMALHFIIALVLAAIYFALSASLPWVSGHPWFGGVLYGASVHVVMNRIVVPLSRAAKRPFSMKAFLTQLIIHIVCVGLPIALSQHYLGR